MRNLNQEELKDLLIGCAVLGTGGGGNLDDGLEMVEASLKKGKKVTMATLEDLPDEVLIASPSICGIVFPEKDRSDGNSLNECLASFEALERYMSDKFYGVIPDEIGGENTAVALSIAAEKGIPIVDADPVGRSAPELQQTTFCIKGVSISPLSLVNTEGDVMIMEKVADHFGAERIARAIAVASGNEVGITDHPTNGKILKESVISGTLTRALHIGEAITDARERDADPVKAAISVGKGFLLFQGSVMKSGWKIEEGFTIGSVVIEGQKDFKGKEYKLWYKNEHIISWFDEQVDVTVPDLICILAPATGQPITNPNCKEEMEVSVIGYPAPDLWRTEAGLKVFGPRAFGYQVTYRPIEEIERLE